MSTEENKTAVRSFLAAMDRDQGMKSALEQLGAPSYKAHFNGMPAMDAAGMAGFGGAFFAACPGLRHEPNDLVAEGNDVALRMTIKGTHTQPFMMPNGPLPATNKSFEMPVMNLFRFGADGKVTEHWAMFDMLGFMQQLGAIPS